MSVTRPHLIGATDAATLIGIGTESQAHMYLRLAGLIEPEEPDLDAFAAGKLAEDGVLKPLIESRFGVTLHRLDPITLPDEPRIGCSPDFLSSDNWLHETKFTGSRAMWGPPGSREVPPGYFCQCQFQLAVARAAGLTVAGDYLAPCFIPGFDIQRYPIEEDREIGDRMLQAARDMLRRVDKRMPPDPHDEADARDLLLARRGELHVVTDHEYEALQDIRRLQEEARAAEKKAKELRDLLIPGFGTATEIITGSGEVVATWRANREFDAEAFALSHPDIAMDYMIQKLDTARLRKEHRKLCEQFQREPLDPQDQTRVLRFSREA